MQILVIVQDLRISGTSEGMVSRSFLGKLRKSYPQSTIHVMYLKNFSGDDELELIPVSSLEEIRVKTTVPFLIKLVNHLSWRIFSFSLNQKYLLDQYRDQLKTIDRNDWDHIFLRSAGSYFETILASKNLSFLKKTVVNFHDSFPIFWDTGTDSKLTKTDFYNFKAMQAVVEQAKTCISPSKSLSEDLEHLYGTTKKFYTLPHQFEPSVFNLDSQKYYSKNKKQIIISYQGALQLRRNLEILLDAFVELVEENEPNLDNLTFIVRTTGKHRFKLEKKYNKEPHIMFKDPVPLVQSIHEQKVKSDILVILDNCSVHSNILVGKAPLISFLKKPFLCLSPERSELRRIVKRKEFIALCDNKTEIKLKLKNLINNVVHSSELGENPFGNYFSEINFQKKLNQIIEKNK